MDISILGPLTVVRDGVQVDVGGSKPRGLLALLALHPGTAQSTDRIVDVLWHGDPPRQAVGTLQAYVSNLRRVLEPDRPPRTPAKVLVTRGDGYLLDIAHDQVDAGRLASHANAARRALSEDDPKAALAETEAALALWRGVPVPELGDVPSIVPERARLDELRTGLREDRAEAAMRTGMPVVGDLETLISEDHLRERPWILLLQVLQRDGRVAEALERYQQYRTILEEEVGLEPSRAMQDLQRQILAGESAAASPTAGEPPPTATRREPGAVATGTGPPPIVGRAAERDRSARLLQTSSERARWLLIIGEPGIGKTTLAEHLASQARASGHAVGWGRCPEEGDAPPYWPISELLDDLGLPSLDDLIAPAEALDDRARTFRLFEGIVRQLVRASASAPLLLVIDDLHWADPATIRLLSHLSGRLRSTPIVVAATLRGEEIGDELDQLLSTLARDARVERLHVGALQQDELRELAVRHGRQLADRELERLADRSSGNPFFATELLRLPTDEWGDDEHASVPAGARDVIRTRLRRLGRDVVDVLTVAAGIGLEFDLPLLLAASGASSEDVLDRLDRALTAELLADAPQGRLRFTHALVRGTLTDDLTFLGHQRLHARLGDALEALPDQQGRIGELARHRLESVPVTGAAAAVDAAMAAARHDASGLAYEQATVWLTAALEVADADPVLSRDGARRYEIQLARGRALLVGGRATEGWDALADAFDLAQERSDSQQMAEAVNSLRIASGAWNWVPVGSRPLELIRRIEAALDALPAGDTSQRVRLLVTLAEGVYFVDPPRSEAIAREAVDLARAEGDDADLAEALVGQLVCRRLATESPAAQLDLVEELEAVPGERPPLLQAPATLVRWRALTGLGQRAGADDALAAAARLTEALPLPSFRAELSWASLTHRMLRNDLADIEEDLERSTWIQDRLGPAGGRQLRSLQLILIRWWQGRVGECEEVFERDFTQAGVPAPGLHALILLGRDRHSEARTLLEAPVPDLPEDWTAVTVACLRAWAAAKLALPERVHDSLRLLAPRRDEIAVWGTSASVGPVALYTGVAHAVLGDTERAEDDLRVAIGHADRGVAGPWGVLARVELGRLLAGCGPRSSESRELFAVARSQAASAGSDEFDRFVREQTVDLEA